MEFFDFWFGRFRWFCCGFFLSLESSLCRCWSRSRFRCRSLHLGWRFGNRLGLSLSLFYNRSRGSLRLNSWRSCRLEVAAGR